MLTAVYIIQYLLCDKNNNHIQIVNLTLGVPQTHNGFNYGS